jgi:hypothetical protein
MGSQPQQDHALLLADAAVLRDCAERLEALTGELPDEAEAEWGGILGALAEHCRVAATDLERAGAHFAGESATYAADGPDTGARGGAPTGAQAALARAGRLPGAPVAAGPGLFTRGRTKR